MGELVAKGAVKRGNPCLQLMEVKVVAFREPL